MVLFLPHRIHFTIETCLGSAFSCDKNLQTACGLKPRLHMKVLQSIGQNTGVVSFFGEIQNGRHTRGICDLTNGQRR